MSVQGNPHQAFVTGNAQFNHKVRIKLLPRVTCPHCWHVFPPEEAVWIAVSPGLLGDRKLGASFPRRFLPTRFTADGGALDIHGGVCKDVACPRCHLLVPKPLFEFPSLICSITGSPSCGKSYFLTAMSWTLRHVLPRHFQVLFSDADPHFNHFLNSWENKQFRATDYCKPVLLHKTEEQGELYNEVFTDGRVLRFPKPFMFTLLPMDQHYLGGERFRAARVLCLYDNAGESFYPGRDVIDNPVTQHLSRAKAILFLFDPTQDARFRSACREVCGDTCWREYVVDSRQDVILSELARRVKRYRGLKETEKCDSPLFIIATKLDVWRPLLNWNFDFHAPISPDASGTGSVLDAGLLAVASAKVRALLNQYVPEIVAAAESFAKRVVYIPVSATGGPPELSEKGEKLGFRPDRVKPMWVEVPMLMVLSGVKPDLVRVLLTERGRSLESAMPSQAPYETPSGDYP